MAPGLPFVKRVHVRVHVFVHVYVQVHVHVHVSVRDYEDEQTEDDRTKRAHAREATTPQKTSEPTIP